VQLLSRGPAGEDWESPSHKMKKGGGIFAKGGGWIHQLGECGSNHIDEKIY